MMQIGKTFVALIVYSLYGTLESTVNDDTDTQFPTETTHFSKKMALVFASIKQFRLLCGAVSSITDLTLFTHT